MKQPDNKQEGTLMKPRPLRSWLAVAAVALCAFAQGTFADVLQQLTQHTESEASPPPLGPVLGPSKTGARPPEKSGVK